MIYWKSQYTEPDILVSQGEPLSEVLRPLNDKSLAAQAFDSIRNAILTMALPPGSLISEATLAHALSISKTPIREALQELHRVGLVEVLPNRGYQVSDLTLEDAYEILALRSRLEGLAAYESCSRLTDEDIKHMDSLLERALTAFQAKDLDTAAELGHEFHQVMINRSGNGRLIALISMLGDQFARLRLISDHIPGRLERSIADHRGILEAIRERNPDKAAERMSSHLLAVCQELNADSTIKRRAEVLEGVGKS